MTGLPQKVFVGNVFVNLSYGVPGIIALSLPLSLPISLLGSLSQMSASSLGLCSELPQSF